RRFLLTSLACAVTVPRAAEAQRAEKVYRIGLLATRPSPLLVDPFVAEMQRYGWSQGSNYALLARFTEGEQQRAPVLATELAQSRVDVLLTINTANAVAAR